MTRSHRRRSPLKVLLIAVVLSVGACGGTDPSPAPSGVLAVSSAPLGSPAPSEAIQPSSGPFTAMAYPVGGDAPCDEAAAPDTSHAPYIGNIRRITATGRRIVVFELCRPDVVFLTRIAAAPFAINDTAWLTTHITPGSGHGQPIVGEVNGTGPYRLDAWHRGSDIILARNEAYWGTSPNLATIAIRWETSAAERLAELQAGTVDGIDDIAPADVETVEGDGELVLAERPGLNVAYLGFGDMSAPFDNVGVRRAISLGIDRRHIVEAFYPPGSEVASHLGPCAIPDGCAGDAWPDYDPALAKQLLGEAGFADGFETTLRVPDAASPSVPDPTAIAEEIRSELLTNLDVRATIAVVPADTAPAGGIALLGDTFGQPDMTSVLGPSFGAGAPAAFRKAFGDVVAAVAAGGSTTDAGARTAASAKANDAIRRQVPIIPLAHAGTVAAFRADVGGALVSPVRQERFASMTAGDRPQFVWLAAREPTGLYCADTTDPVAHLVCAQVSDGLYGFKPGTANARPALARSCEPDPTATTWTCRLKAEVTFHDGASLDANDVVLSFAVQWDADHPLHDGETGRFAPFIDAFGGLLDPPG